MRTTTSCHLCLLRIVSPLTRILTALLLYLLSIALPQFDSSPQVISPAPSALLRWDAFHFAHIAQHGYVHEHEWAFFPGTPLLMRLSGHLLRTIKLKLQFEGGEVTWDDLLQGGALAALACDAATATTLYKLTLHHLRSPHIALIAALLSLLPSSPAALRFAAYSEPFFTLLSYKGMLHCARTQWFSASVCFALASAFRSNGILLGGFVVWGMLVQPFLDRKRIHPRTAVYCAALTALPFLPFAYHHYAAYIRYCVPDPHSLPSLYSGPSTRTRPTVETDIPAWCARLPPSIYTHAQAKYWDNGFLHYWTPAQLPNFVIAAPVYALLFAFCGWHLWGRGGEAHAHSPVLSWCWPLTSRAGIENARPNIKPTPSESQSTATTTAPPDSRTEALNPFLAPTLTPHALHALFLALTLLFTAHVQIVLRQAAALPLVYWAGAWLVVRDSPAQDAAGGPSGRGGNEKGGRWRWGTMWVGWSVVWGAAALVLWAAFLPPA